MKKIRIMILTIKVYVKIIKKIDLRNVERIEKIINKTVILIKVSYIIAKVFKV